MAGQSDMRRADANRGIPWHLADLDIVHLHQEGITGDGVRIGVVDTGVVSHVDLPASQVTAIDSRGPGFDTTDHNGHGTGMLGILLGAQGAMCPKAHVISARVATGAGGADLDAVVAAIGQLLAMEVDLISISMGTRSSSDSLAASIQTASEAGVAVIASAEDGPSPVPLYPGFYASVIAVTAIDRDKRLLFAPAPAWVDAAAPGRQIVTLGRDGGRVTMEGTSPATAICAGVVALLLGMAPPGDRRRALAGQLLGFVTQGEGQPVGARGPADPRLLAPRELCTAVRSWLKSTVST